MSVIKVTAFDPGITTGYATGLIENGKMGVVSGQDKWNEFELYVQLKRSKPDVVIYETFEYRNQPKVKRDKVVLFSRNLIGVLNLYVYERHSQKMPVVCVQQTPFQGKSYFTDNVLKKHGLHKPGRLHANDAVRHILQWYQFGPGYEHNKHGYEALA